MDHFAEEINQKYLMNKKHKRTFIVLNYIEHLLILSSVITGCVSISAFGSLVAIPVGITSCATVLKNFQTTAGTKNYKSMIKKIRKKHDKIELLAKTMLNAI